MGFKKSAERPAALFDLVRGVGARACPIFFVEKQDKGGTVWFRAAHPLPEKIWHTPDNSGFRRKAKILPGLGRCQI
ncbi:MAG: hypothetical protein ACK4Q5_05655 [Saprospiraceae bacterium]